MSSNTASFKLPAGFLPLFLLLLATAALRPLEHRLTAPSIQLVELNGLGGSGLLGVLGGMRSAVASGLWLRANEAWERQDAAGTPALLQLTVAADERPLYFWINGARMLAYDIPTWGAAADQPEVVRRKAAAAGAAAAQVFLEAGLRAHPQSAELLVELGNIQLRAGGDRAAAAAWFRRAAEQPDAPYYAARIHGELLRELGRPAEALAWLRKILPGLPADDPAARRGVVEQRIKALEAELGEK